MNTISRSILMGIAAIAALAGVSMSDAKAQGAGL